MLLAKIVATTLCAATMITGSPATAANLDQDVKIENHIINNVNRASLEKTKENIKNMPFDKASKDIKPGFVPKHGKAEFNKIKFMKAKKHKLAAAVKEEKGIPVYGVVVKGDKPVEGAKVVLRLDGVKECTVFTGKSGEYEFNVKDTDKFIEVVVVDDNGRVVTAKQAKIEKGDRKVFVRLDTNQMVKGEITLTALRNLLITQILLATTS